MRVRWSYGGENNHVVLAVVAGAPPAPVDAVPPTLPLPRADPSKPFPKPTLKAIFDKEGPAAFAKAVRKHEYDDAVKLRRCVAGGGWMEGDGRLITTTLLRLPSRFFCAPGASF